MKTQVIWINVDGETLFKEEILYSQIPTIGSKVKWLTLEWEVMDITHNFDENRVEVSIIRL